MKKTFFLFFALGGFAAVAALPDPIAYFSFDAVTNGVVADLSGNGRVLTLGTGCSLTNDSAAGSALWLEGAQNTYAQFAVPELKKRTISLWYKRSSQPGPWFEASTSGTAPADRGHLMPTLIANLSKFNLRFNNSWANANDHSLGVGDYYIIAYYGSGGNLGGVYFSYLNYPQFCPEKWTHLAYAIEITNSMPTGVGSDHLDTFNVRIYMNGTLYFGQDGCTTTNAYPSGTATLGNSTANGTRPCRGTIDEFKVFDEFLTQDQIVEEYNRCKDSANRFNLLAWYPFQTFSDPDGDGNRTTPDLSPWGVANDHVMDCSYETSVVSGPHGTDKAIHFQGTAMTHAYARVPYKVDDFTMSAWVNCSTNTSILRIAGQTSNFPRLITFGNFASYYYWPINLLQNQYMMPGDTTVRTFSYNHGLASKGDWQHITWVVRNVRTSTDTVANSFNQVYDYYINGEFVGSGTEVAGGILGANTMLVLGSPSTTSNVRPFEGDVSDFRLYAGAMDAREVAALYRGAATVDAGVDRTVKGIRAVLSGTVGTHDAGPCAYGYAGDVSWSLVSAPSGVETVAFLRPNNPVTEVDLPVEGEYVFRLATKGFLGAANADTVTIVRDDAAGTADAVPAVDVASVAAEAALRSALTNGLIRHWTFNGLAHGESISGTRGMNLINWSQIGLTNGVTGGALFSRPGVPFGGTVKTDVTSGELAGPYGNGYEPTNEWLSVSAWIRPDSAYPDDWFAGVIAHLPITLSVCYGQWWGQASFTGVVPGFSILQTGILGYQAYLNYDLPSGTTMDGLCDGWQHVVAIVNRHQTALSEFYLNGVKLSENTSRRSCGNYGTYTADKGSAVYFSGKPCGGRRNTDPVYLLNTQNELGGVNNTIFCASNTTTHVVRSRHFPGAVDEVRFYNRKLTADEISFLHAHPDLAENAAPVVAKATADLTRVSAKKTDAVSAAAADDGNPGSLTYRWLVLEGDAAQVVFADAAARETSVKFLVAGDYTLCLVASDGERTTYGEPVKLTAVPCGTWIFVR